MKKANPKLIGVFVVGGVLLVVAALVLFSSQDLLSPKRQFVAYFQQSVNGLNVGAPVRFRGIPIGEVINIDGVYDPDTGNMIPRLIIEVRPETMEGVVLEEGDYTIFASLVKKGMRASLKSASLLTGQLYVALDYHPGTVVRKLGSGNDEYPEMPTLDSGFSEALEKFSSLPLEEFLSRAGGTLAATEELLRNPHIGEVLAALPKLLNDVDTTVVALQLFIVNDLPVVAQDIGLTLADVRVSLMELTTTLNEDSLMRLSATLGEFEKTLQLAQRRLSPDDRLMHELVAALHEVSSAARSVRGLADTLDEHPESLVSGKRTQ